jgi:uncharacterized protein YbgA (DUF1722 family)/uncharacterized protein YbbK (DUF523 family)
MKTEQSFPKPVIVVSECLGFAAVRFNGQQLNDHFLQMLAAYATLRPICPEVEIGLGVPRMPIRLVDINGEDHLVQTGNENFDVTDKMIDFSEKFLNSQEKVHGFVLKFGSPSCGTSNVKVYHQGNKPSVERKTRGLFAAKVKEKFPDLVVEDEGRLKNFKIREHFLTAVFSLARWDEVKATGKMKELVAFHSNMKYLLMAYNQTRMRAMGKIVANHDKLTLEDVFSAYEIELRETLAHLPKKSNFINSLMHMAGYFSKTNSAAQKLFFSEMLEMYRDGRIPLSSLIMLIKSWAIRDEEQYILNQSILSPFPLALLELSDSGRVIEL